MLIQPDLTKIKKVFRVLVYPNITWMKDLSQDSFVRDILLDIACLNELRDDLWFYVIMPTVFAPLSDFPNVTQLILPLPSHPPQMRVHFDSDAVKALLSANLDFDIVFSHLPEHTAQLAAILENNTHHCPRYIGYSHWFDFKKQITWNKGTINQNILGMLEMDTCFVNTQAQKDLVLDEAAELFNVETVAKLDHIMRVCYLGVEEDMFVSDVRTEYKKVIAFNHRPWKYKDFDGFIRIMDALYEQRQDFKAWVPLLEQDLNRPYLTRIRKPKPEYYNLLSKCCVAFAPKQMYAGWSNSATDAMANGCPVVFYDANYYRELYPEGDFFTNDDECLALLNKYLDRPKFRNRRANESVEFMRESRMHLDSLRGVSLVIDDSLSRMRSVRESSEALERMVGHIEKQGTITKQNLVKAMKWGPSIMWTPYRTALMRHPNVMEYFDKEPTYVWVDNAQSRRILKKQKSVNVTNEAPHTLGDHVTLETARHTRGLK